MYVQRLNIQNQPIKIFGDGLYQAQINTLNSFIINAQSAYNPSDEIKILIHPLNYSCQIQIIDNQNGIWIVNYIPEEIGQILIDIYLNDKLININPYKVNIFDINQIIISNLHDGFVNQLVKFHIDTSKAGIGQLEILVQNGQGLCEAISHNSSQFDVTFLPHQAGLYKIDIKYNGLIIPGSPFSCYIRDLSRVIVSNDNTHVQIGNLYSFDIYHQTEFFDVIIKAPSGRSIDFKRTELNEKHTRIDYILNEIGLHEVNIQSKETMDMYRSDFSLQVYDKNRLIVSDIPHVIIFNKPVEFMIDASKAGEGQLEVDINNGLVPNQVKSLGNSKFHFTFIPILNEIHRISIKFNGELLDGFPKECQVISSDDIQIHGPGLSQVLINTPTWFTIDGGSADFQVSILTPTSEQLNPSTLLTSTALRVDWTPVEIGTYVIQVTLQGNSIPGSPFHAKCYNPEQVIVTPPTSPSSIGKPTKLLIDAIKAGEGNLEISVNHFGHNIPNQINPLGKSRYEIEFIPQQAIIHYCIILFNGEPVPGSPFPINVMESQRIIAIGKGLGTNPINIPTSFTVLIPNSLTGDLKCLIKGPDDQLISCIITKLDSNRYEVTYTPDRVGEFHIEILYNNNPIDNSPYLCRSFDINKIKIENFPSTTTVDTPTYFLIDATDAGSGNLEISISRDGKNIPNYVQNEGGARFRIKFIPDQSSIHHIQIKFNGIDIPNSPFLCNVYSSEFTFENYEYASINKNTTFLIKPKLNSRFNPNIHVDIITPSGKEIKGKIEKLTNNFYSVDFYPSEIGDHEIKFYHNDENKLIMSKFLCQVYDLTKIRISDLPVAIQHKLYKFTIDTTDAGNGTLLVKLKQNEKKLGHEQKNISPHVYEISFTPETIEECSMQIVFNGENYPRTLIIPVTNDYEPVHVSPIPVGVVGQPTVFTIDVADSNLISIRVTESHSGRTVPHTMKSLSNMKNRYEISFTPNITRQHTVSISYDGKLFSTYNLDVCNINKIRVSSLNDGIVGIPLIFSVDTHGAGEGHLEVTISDGHQTLPAELKSIQSRKFDIAFIPEISGKHSIEISFNGIPIQGNPFLINIHEPSISDRCSSESDNNNNREFLIGGQLEGTKVGEVAWIICETGLTEFYEDLNLYVKDPDGTTIKHTRIQDSAGRWRIEFEPTKEGIHQIESEKDESSPINFTSVEILPLNYERNIYGERIIHPNALNFVSITSQNENLEIELKDSQENKIPIEIEKESLEYKIYFTLANMDCYQLRIKDDENEQIFQIHCVAEETDFFRNGGIEDIARLIIDHSKIFTDDVNVIVKNPLAHTIPAAFYRNLNNDLVIEYIPVRKGIHEVFIRTQNNLLDICPIRINAHQSTNQFDPVLRVQVKEILEHTFPGVIDPDNKLEITVMDPFERSIPFQRSQNELGELTISLSPVRVGTHWMRISNDENDSFALIPIFAYDDDYVPLSPVGTPSSEEKLTQNQTNSQTDSVPIPLDLTTISESSEFLSSISPQHQLNIPNEHVNVNIQTLDIVDLIDPGVRILSKFSLKDPKDEFNIIIYDAKHNSVRYKTERFSDGRKSISYEVTVIGPVEIHILKDNKSIDGSPLTVHAYDPLAVGLLNLPKKVFLNTINSFTIDATRAGKGSLKITIKDPNNRSLPITVEKQANNHINIQFKPIIIGLHTISILFNRIPIPNTPIEIIVENKEERGRSVHSKYDLFVLSKEQEKLNVPSRPSSQTKSIRTSKSYDNIPQKDTEDKLQNKSEYVPFNENETRKFQLLKEKFDQKQPIDVVFDPRPYPFKVYLQNSLPVINTDIHLLFNLVDLGYVSITLNDMKIPLQSVRKSLDTFLVKFRPTLAGDYLITLKNHYGQTILACPYIFPVYNPHGIHIESYNQLQPINDCHFICNIDNIGKGKFFLMVYYQSKPIRISYKILHLTQTRIQINLFPLKIGTYRIYLAYRNIPINGIPIDITVYDSQAISIVPQHREPVIVNSAVAYKVNTSEAGQGELKGELIPPETSVLPCQCHINKLTQDEYIIEYIPNDPGRYQLRLLYNNQLIQGKTIDTDVYSLSPVAKIEKIFPLTSPKLGDDVCLQVITDKPTIQSQISCNGMCIPCQLKQTKDKHIWHLKFRPYIIGTYRICLFHDGVPLLKSPYLIPIKDIDGKNYLSGLTDTPCIIQIHAKSASPSQIRAVVLLGTIQMPSILNILNNNLIRINFTPHEPGLYYVHIHNDNQPIDGSPFLIHVKRPEVVQVSGKCLQCLRLNDLGIFRIHCNEQHGLIKAKIFYLSNQISNDICQLISFQLVENYEQLSKFSFEFFQSLLINRLKLTNERIRNLIIENENGHTVISFQLYDTSLPSNEQVINQLKTLIDKEMLNLSDPNNSLLHPISGSVIIGSKGEPVNVKLFSLPNGDFLGEFTPKKIGQYRIDITFASIPIDGSPFFTEVYDPLQVKLGSLSKDIIVGIENTFDIDLNNAGNAPLDISITSPMGINVPCKINEISKIKKVRFIPTETGLHHLNIKFGLDTIPGVPIKLMVNNTRIITAYGDGLHNGFQDKVTTFMIDTKNMQGDLKVQIEDSQSVIKNTLTKINESLFKVTYMPNNVGPLNISIKWNGKDIVNSPFTAIITNPERVRVIGGWPSVLDSQNRLCVITNEEKQIRFDTSDAGPGMLKVDIRTINNESIPFHLDQTNTFYTLSFTIPQDGKYNLRITYADHLLPKMPIPLIASSVIPVNVLLDPTTNDYSLSQVICSGDGLRMGIVGQESKCLIDTRNANPGELTVYCQGIHKTALCRLIDHHNGTFTLFIKPEETGKHILTIKYNGEHVPGSPYTVKVSGPPDARKVRVFGPGIEHGVLSTFQSNFVCETKGAGAGQLTVQIRGPKGAFRVEMKRKTIHDRTIICRYNPTESGDYIISVKWSGKHVYGSPFHARIFDYQHELERFQYELNNYRLTKQEQKR